MKRFFSLVLLTLLCFLLPSCATMRVAEAELAPIEIEMPTIELAAIDPPMPIVEIEYRDVPMVRELHERAVVNMTDAEITCMANAIYYESKSESRQGQIGVGYVILNRMAHHGFTPDTVCGIVNQTHNRNGKRRCEFSWVCTHNGQTRKNARQYATAQEIAIAVMRREVDNPVDNAVFFHARHVRPGWARTKFLLTLDNHRFYASTI